MQCRPFDQFRQTFPLICTHLYGTVYWRALRVNDEVIYPIFFPHGANRNAITVFTSAHFLHYSFLRGALCWSTENSLKRLRNKEINTTTVLHTHTHTVSRAFRNDIKDLILCSFVREPDPGSTTNCCLTVVSVITVSVCDFMASAYKPVIVMGGL